MPTTLPRAVSLVAALALGACVAPWSDDGEGSEHGLDRGLAAEGEVAIPAEVDGATGTEATTSTQPSGPSTGPGGTTAGNTRPGRVGTDGRARRLALATDRAGDIPVNAPDWTDLRSTELFDTGDGRLRVTVTMAATIPPQLEEQTVAGIGVDLFVTGKQFSDYQLFFEGEDEGWFAYLETPRGFVKFPGSFQIARDQFVATITLASIRNHTSGAFSVFADYSTAQLVAVAISSEDHLPNRGRADYG